SASSTRSFNVAICCLYLSWQMNHIVPAIGTASTATAVTNGRGQFHATSQKPGAPAMTIDPVSSLGLALHRRRGRVLELEPTARAAEIQLIRSPRRRCLAASPVRQAREPLRFAD